MANIYILLWVREKGVKGGVGGSRNRDKDTKVIIRKCSIERHIISVGKWIGVEKLCTSCGVRGRWFISE